ncbi:hypothetical protein [Nodosilinea sp. FACHB-13]|uniref:hypothetical protein n=1 Tax=Cyanophyceae TaxID=3028117 RepID=UPI0016849860|nr:hypothetical protein [Nodosilinea sp. FACHB-13]MBD2106714.1 hypothetical protein [Nodosilinea sp. FACHB-13]
MTTSNRYQGSQFTAPGPGPDLTDEGDGEGEEAARQAVAEIDAQFTRNHQRADSLDEADPATVKAQINAMFQPQTHPQD